MRAARALAIASACGLSESAEHCERISSAITPDSPFMPSASAGCERISPAMAETSSGERIESPAACTAALKPSTVGSAACFLRIDFIASLAFGDIITIGSIAPNCSALSAAKSRSASAASACAATSSWIFFISSGVGLDTFAYFWFSIS